MRRTLISGLALFKIRAAEGLQYRFAAFSGSLVSSCWALIEIIVITVFFKFGNNTSENINGLTLLQSISYIWIAQSSFGLIAMGIDGDIQTKIVNGDISVELCRPLNLYWHWFARTAAGSASNVILRGGMVFLVGIVLSVFGLNGIGIGLPHSPINLLLFLTSLFLAFLFGASFNMFVTAIRTGIAWGDGPMNMMNLLASIFSGTYLPLQLWPDFMQNFLRFQPFAGSLDTPARLYVGSTSLNDGFVSMFFQLMWIVVFIIFGQMIMKSKIKNAVIQGG